MGSLPYPLWRFSHKFEHPKSTPYYFSFPLMLSVTWYHFLTIGHIQLTRWSGILETIIATQSQHISMLHNAWGHIFSKQTPASTFGGRPPTIVQEHIFTQTLLHTEAFTQRNLNTAAFTHKCFYTHRSLYKNKPLHKAAFTHRSFHA